MSTQTPRETMLAVLQGREHDRVPFAQYVLSQRFCESFPLREDVCAALGPESVGFIRLVGVFNHVTPNCRFEQDSIVHEGREAIRHTLMTPKGNLNEIRFVERTLHSTAAATHYVKTPEDYEVLLAYLKDVQVEKDLSDFYAAAADLGDYGLQMCYLPRSPYQQMWIQWVGIADLALHLAEEVNLLGEVMATIEDINTRTFALICEIIKEAPIPYLVFGDNLTAPMIGEHYFRKYSVPAYNEMAAMVKDTGKNVPVMVHTDGYLKPLWDAFSDTQVSGLESLSPPPDNDTSVAEALSRWPHMRLLVNFPSPAHLLEPDEIYAIAVQILEEGGRRGRLQIQISEDIPPDVWRKSYPPILKAIEDFGAAC